MTRHWSKKQKLVVHISEVMQIIVELHQKVIVARNFDGPTWERWLVANLAWSVGVQGPDVQRLAVSCLHLCEINSVDNSKW